MLVERICPHNVNLDAIVPKHTTFRCMMSKLLDSSYGSSWIDPFDRWSVMLGVNKTCDDFIISRFKASSS